MQMSALIMRSESNPFDDQQFMGQEEKFYFAINATDEVRCPNSNQVQSLLSKYEWLKLVQHDRHNIEQQQIVLLCVYCDLYYTFNDYYSVQQFLTSHQQSNEHKCSRLNYASTKADHENYMDRFLMLNETIADIGAIPDAQSAQMAPHQELFKTEEEYGSILKAINKRKLHISCPLCVSKVVNMSDHLVKKHLIRDRNQRKCLMDTVRRNYLKSEQLNELEHVEYKQEHRKQQKHQQHQHQHQKVTMKTKAIKKPERKLVQCPICTNKTKYFVNISDHLIKVHRLITSELRKPILKSIKTSKNNGFSWNGIRSKFGQGNNEPNGLGTPSPVVIVQKKTRNTRQQRKHSSTMGRAIRNRYKKFYKRRKPAKMPTANTSNKSTNTDELDIHHLEHTVLSNSTNNRTASVFDTDDFLFSTDDAYQSLDDDNFLSNSCFLMNNPIGHFNQSSASSTSNTSTNAETMFLFSASPMSIDNFDRHNVTVQPYDSNGLLIKPVDMQHHYLDHITGFKVDDVCF